MPRYDDVRPEYDRPRDSVRRNDGRDVRRAVEPTERRTAATAGPIMEREYPMDDAMDVRMDNRPGPGPEPRAANIGNPRVQGPPRGMDPHANRGEVLYRDPRTGELYRDVPSRRTPYENEFEDIQPSSRPIVVSAAEPGAPKPIYGEYFLPGEGIEREVIQAEICRYLGQDATCRPGKGPDGRNGFLIKAYRALTTEMIRSLQESSAKFRSELVDKEKRRRRPDAIAYTPIQDHSYDRDTEMDDDRAYVQPERYTRELDPRDPRAQMGNRQYPPVTTAYLPEPGYQAYSIPPGQPSMPQMAFEQRNFAPTGNTTPPTGMRTTYAPAPDYPSRTAQPAPAPMPAQSYMDPRAGKMVGSYPSYATDGRRR